MNAARILAAAGRDSSELRAVIHPVRPEEVGMRPAPRLFRVLWRPGVAGVALGSRVFVDPGLLRGDGDRLALLVIHELVHIRQIREAGRLSFAARYLRDYRRGRASGMSRREAYLAIPAEVEARETTARLT